MSCNAAKYGQKQSFRKVCIRPPPLTKTQHAYSCLFCIFCILPLNALLSCTAEPILPIFLIDVEFVECEWTVEWDSGVEMSIYWLVLPQYLILALTFVDASKLLQSSSYHLVQKVWSFSTKH